MLLPSTASWIAASAAHGVEANARTDHAKLGSHLFVLRGLLI